MHEFPLYFTEYCLYWTVQGSSWRDDYNNIDLAVSLSRSGLKVWYICSEDSTNEPYALNQPILNFFKNETNDFLGIFDFEIICWVKPITNAKNMPSELV